MVADHFSRYLHQVFGLGRIAQYVGGTYQNLLSAFWGAKRFHAAASLKG